MEYSYKKKKGAKVAPPTMPESEGGSMRLVGIRLTECCSPHNTDTGTLGLFAQSLRCG